MPEASTDLFAASAGLDVVSGVFGYLTSLNAASIARSRADMIRAESEANAQRYSERSQAEIAQQKAMYLSSGVTLAGSPIDTLDKNAQIAQQNIESIRMSGLAEAFDQKQQGENALTTGRNALLGGISAGAGVVTKGATLSLFAGKTGFDVATPNQAGEAGMGLIERTA